MKIKSATFATTIASTLLLSIQAFSSPTSRRVPVSSSANRFFQHQSRHANYVALIGFGPLWHSSTGLSDGDGASGDDVATGIEIRDARLIQSLKGCLRFSDQRRPRLYTKNGDSISFAFCSAPPRKEDGVMPWWIDHSLIEVQYYRNSGKGYGVFEAPMNTARAMPVGSGSRLRAFVRRMARRARAHRKGVSYFYYGPQSLNPS